MKPLPSPNIRPQPITQNEIVEAANTMKFLVRMLVAFLARQRPLSTSAKPAFMKNTSIAVTSTHTVSMPMRRSLLEATSLSITSGVTVVAASSAPAAVAASNVAAIAALRIQTFMAPPGFKDPAAA